IVLSELQKRGLCFRDWIAMTNCSVENAYRLLVGRFPLDPDLKITAALALRIDPEEFIFRYDTSKSTTASEAKRAKRFCELVIAMMEHKKLTKSEFIHKSGVHSFTADTMLAGETTSLLYRTLEKTSAALEIPIETIIDHISGLKPAI
ncbi:MAG: helix-turn-helix transcriptional regulator, partial [Sutterella sp.]|nr:helix-turn-helix transcriptional regulator [Sutterella sp.]